MGQLTKKPNQILPTNKLPFTDKVIQLDLGAGDRLLMTVKPGAAAKLLEGVKAADLSDLLKSGEVEHVHIDSVDGGLKLVPKDKVLIKLHK